MNRSPVYRKIYASLFNDPDWLTLPPNLRWLYVVMLTGSQSNSVGCYICRLSVLSEDAGFEVKQSDIDRVCSVMGIQYLIPYRILFIPNWLKWNQPDSSKVLIGYIKSLSCLPNCETVNTLRDTLSDTLSKIDSMRSSEVGFTELWNRLYDGSVYPILYPMAYPMVYQEQEPEQEPEPKPQPKPEPKPKENNVEPSALVPATPKPCDVVFNHWRSVTGHNKAILDPKRTKLINAALKLGYTVEQLKQAIDGNKASPFHQGNNDRKMVYDGLDLILRDAAQIDKFIALADGRGTSQYKGSFQELDDHVTAQLERLGYTEKVVQ